MKHRKVAPLLADVEPATYVMDSCAYFDIRDLGDQEMAWGIVLGLIAAGRMAAPNEQIEQELKLDEGVWDRLGPVESSLRANRTDETFLLRAGKIAAAFPAMCGLRSKRTRADPFIVALAYLESWTVVTNENANRRPSKKIPFACGKLGIKCIRLCDLLTIEAAMRK